MPREAASFNPLAEIVGMPPQDLTDRLLLDLHVNQLRVAAHSPNSLRAREGAIIRLHRHLDPGASNPRAVVEADPSDLTGWQAGLGHLAPASVAKYVQHVRLFYDWLVRPMRVIEESPAGDLVKPLVKRRNPRPIPEDDLSFALDACADRMVYAWLVLGAYAGLRSVDIAALRTDDLILGGSVPFLRVRGKGGHEDMVAVGMQVVQVIAGFQGRRGALFVTGSGQAIPCEKIDREVNEYLARVGLAYTFHQLRHRYGTKLYEITRDIRYTQKQMRHRSVESTEIYTLVFEEHGNGALEVLDADLEKHSRERRRR